MRGSLVFVFYVMILLGLSGLAKADNDVIVNMTCSWSEDPQGEVIESVPAICMKKGQKFSGGDIQGRLDGASLRYCADPIGDRYLMSASFTEKRGSYFTAAQQCRKTLR
jgi:hypothetical protein